MVITEFLLYFTHTYTCMCAYTYIHLHTYTHIYTHTFFLLGSQRWQETWLLTSCHHFSLIFLVCACSPTLNEIQCVHSGATFGLVHQTPSSCGALLGVSPRFSLLDPTPSCKVPTHKSEPARLRPSVFLGCSSSVSFKYKWREDSYGYLKEIDAYFFSIMNCSVNDCKRHPVT